jgi:3-oxoadipate enol-lactonase/4-carboxymuconolactone decarboxylase
MTTTLSSEGVEVAYRSVGTGPPDLLFLHGWAGSAAYFEESFGALDLQRARAIGIDLSGHGESPSHDAEWSLDGIDVAVLSVANAAGSERFVSVGYSMGAKFALHLAVTHPDRVAALVLVSGSPAATIPIPAEVLDDWYSRAGDAGAMKDLIVPFLTGPVDEAAHDRFAREAARVPRAALEGSLKLTVESDFAAALPAIAVPTLVIAGTRDTLFTPELLRESLVDQIPGARLALVDCGHEVPLERPGEFAALIEAFLAGLRGDAIA